MTAAVSSFPWVLTAYFLQMEGTPIWIILLIILVIILLFWWGLTRNSIQEPTEAGAGHDEPADPVAGVSDEAEGEEAGLEANLEEETGATSEEAAPPSGDDQLPAEEGTRPAEEEAVSEPEDEGTNDPAKDEPAEADEPDSSTK